MGRVRLDALLAQRGVFASRARAAAAVQAGDVLLLPERRRADKPGQLVAEDVELEVRSGPEYVSRGGIKLDADARRRALIEVGEAARGMGCAVLGYASSGLPGPKGNRETFIWLAERSRPGIDDIFAAASEVEA